MSHTHFQALQPVVDADSIAQLVTAVTQLSAISAKLAPLGHEGDFVVGAQKNLVYERGNVAAANLAEFITAYPQWTVTNNITGADISTAGGKIVVNCGTGIGTMELKHNAPLSGEIAAKFTALISQRVAGQSITLGFENVLADDGAHVLFDGIVATNVKGRYISDGITVDTAVLAVASTAVSGTYGVFSTDGMAGVSSGTTNGVLNSLSTVTDTLLSPGEDYFLTISITNANAVTATTLTLGPINCATYTSDRDNSYTPRQNGTNRGAGLPVSVSDAVPFTVLGDFPTLRAGSAAIVPVLTVEATSTALTATATLTAAALTIGGTFMAVMYVSAATGTLPTLDVVVQLFDGFSWRDVYHFQRVTAAGTYRSAPLALNGTAIRYVQTVGGTTPSFTRAISRLSCTTDVNQQLSFNDRALVVTTLNSVTPTFDVQGAKNLQLSVQLGAATTGGAYVLEGSNDGTAGSWYALGAALTGVANSTIEVGYTSSPCSFVRARVSTAATGATLVVATIKAF